MFFLCIGDGMTIAQRVAARYAREVTYRDFGQLMQWLGPKAYAAHKKFPDGFRSFNTTTREFRFNIDPKDYLSYDINEAKRMMSEGASLQEVVNPVAYRAMKDVIEALRRRRIRFNMAKVPWTEGGSYIEAIFPKPKHQAPEPEEPEDVYEADPPSEPPGVWEPGDPMPWETGRDF